MNMALNINVLLNYVGPTEAQLKTIVAVDTRMTDRSAEPTLKESIGSICFCSLRCEKYISAYYQGTMTKRRKLGKPLIILLKD
jgi:hypothetical protein